MNLEDAKKAVRSWLWENPARTTVNREWDNQYITDAAQMLMETACKLEQLDIAYKNITDATKADRLSMAVRLFEKDPHQFSKRPCTTCQTITELINRPFGCNAVRL